MVDFSHTLVLQIVTLKLDKIIVPYNYFDQAGLSPVWAVSWDLVMPSPLPRAQSDGHWFFSFRISWEGFLHLPQLLILLEWFLVGNSCLSLQPNACHLEIFWLLMKMQKKKKKKSHRLPNRNGIIKTVMSCACPKAKVTYSLATKSSGWISPEKESN